MSWTPQREAMALGLLVLAMLIAAMWLSGVHVEDHRTGVKPAHCDFSIHEGFGCVPEPPRDKVPK